MRRMPTRTEAIDELRQVLHWAQASFAQIHRVTQGDAVETRPPLKVDAKPEDPIEPWVGTRYPFVEVAYDFGGEVSPYEQLKRELQGHLDQAGPGARLRLVWRYGPTLEERAYDTQLRIYARYAVVPLP